ncbi:hypothetical protein [Actinoplanes utahensis]|uniref:PknH-like extracellular domain-containing protein n=1 Tax=Actinoplanes utahensis TaxID=1869 RepID=A0A0A6UV07_ACTUT|nr:hypothetical protein [Actinoplanes utahensis]KHD79281.1 hypothetical protein MB27_01405 [Actinoplanes utahensis]GIF30273.1 hypothetical protein Aut01nite_32590 [Actinoplanes utahensis]
MGFSTHKTMALVGAVAVVAGLGLTTPAYAAPPPSRPAPLAKSLLTTHDVPHGYVPGEAGNIRRMLGAALAAHRPGADPCAAGRPAPRPAPAAGRSAIAVFLHPEKGTVLAEALADTGEETAADLVAAAGTMLAKCPVVTTADGRLEIEPSRWNPPLGDESITLGLRFGWDEPASRPALRGRMALVAYRNLVLIVGLIGIGEPDERDLKRVVRAAVRKLVLTSGISVKERT